MARKARDGGAKSQNGVSDNGGNGEGGNPASNDGPGSGDGGGGDGDGGIVRPSLDGASDGNDSGDGGTGSGPRPKRGRPSGSRTAKKAEFSVTSLAEVIAFAHVGLAAVLKNDAWSLDDAESRKLADAAAKVLRHHDTPAFSAYAMDWVGLIMVAGNIYAPRIAVAWTATPARPAPVQSAQQMPGEQPAVQGDGYIEIMHPSGNGQKVRMPAAN